MPRTTKATPSGSRDVASGEWDAPRLPSKLTRPRAACAIARPRLFHALDRLSERPIVWVHGPAGAGKTTLITTYVEARKIRALWYVVDRADADASALFHHARVGVEALVKRRLSLPEPHPGSPEPPRAFAVRFFAELVAALPRGAVLVFDSFENAAEALPWNEAFRALCDALRPGVRVVVASRRAPPTELARLCGAGDLQILDWSSLRLEKAEVDAFIERGRKGRLAEEPCALDGAELLAFTDGWAVAVALASQSPTSSAPVLGVPAAETSSGQPPRRAVEHNATIFQFLATEVLDRLDPSSRGLLVEVALMPTFSAEMASALTRREDAAALLARLYDDHLLVERHGEVGFRLHDLLRAFLLQRGRAEHTEAGWGELSKRAALLLAEDDQFVAAVEVLTAALAWPELGDHIERHAPRLASLARLSTLETALGLLPPEELEARPWLMFWQAVITLGRPSGAALALAERAFAEHRRRGDVAGALLAWSVIIQAIVIAGVDFHQIGHWLRTLDDLSMEPPAPPIAVRVAAARALAFTFWDVGTENAVAAADHAMEVVGRFGTAEDRVQVAGTALLAYYVGGHVERARDVLRLARARVDEASSDPLPRLAYRHSEAILEMSSANFRASTAAVEEGLALARSSGIDAWTGSLLMVGMMSATAHGDLASAERLLDAMSLGATRGPPFARSQYAYGRAWLAFEHGDVDAALRWHASVRSDREKLGFLFGQCQEGLARVVFESDRGDRAAITAAAKDLEELVARIPSPSLAAAALLTRAYTALALGDDAVETLQVAFRRAREVGATNPGFLGSRAVARLATAALEHDIEPEFAGRLIRAYEIRPGPRALSIRSWPWPLKIRALGPLELEVDGRRVQFGRKVPTVPLALLKVLVASTEPLTAERLTTALWPGSDAPRGSLDTALYRLRKLLGVDVAIESTNGHLALAEGAAWTDVRAFETACDRITELSGAGQPPPSEEFIDQQEQRLLDLYRGPFGAEGDPPVVVRARERLRRRFVRAVGDLNQLWDGFGAAARRDRLTRLALARNGLAGIE